MLNIAVPTKFVLTLQSVPPFIFECLFALALVLLLSVPLITRIYFLFDDSAKVSSRASLSRKVSFSTIKKRTIVMHYPAPLIKSTSSSSLSVTVTPVRNTISSPIPKSSNEDIKVKVENQSKTLLEDPLSLNQSISFVATNFEVPVIDISSVDYESYRHKLIEALLKKHYDEKQAPGDMVLNTICLNSTDSKTEKKLKNRPGYNLFDIEENPEPGKAIKKREVEYLHPLDHFLVQGFRKPETSDKATETKDSVSEIDEVPELVGWPTTPKRPLSLYSRRRNINSNGNSRATIKSSSPTADLISKNANVKMIDLLNKNETQQLFSRSNVPKVDVKLDNDSPQSQSPRKQLRTPKTQPSTGSLQKSMKSSKSNQYAIFESKKNPRVENLHSNTQKNDLVIRKEDRIDYSASSSEVGSVSSKFKENCSYRSKSSFNTIKNQASVASHPIPWFFGSQTNSFNRKYATPRPRSTGGRLSWEKPTALSRDWYSNPSSASESRCTTPRYRRSTSPERKEPTENKIDNKNREDDENSNFTAETKEKKSLNMKSPTDSKSFVTNSRITKASGQKSYKLKSVSSKCSDAKIEDTKSSDVKSSKCAGAKSPEVESLGPNGALPKFVPISNTSLGKSNNTLPKSPMDSESSNPNPQIRKTSGLKSCKLKSTSVISSDAKFENGKSSDLRSSKCAGPKISKAESLGPTGALAMFVPISNTSLGKSNSTLPKSSNPSASRPSSGSHSRRSESYLPVHTKNHLAKNKLNSDSFLVGKEPSVSVSKSLERPKSSKIRKLQRPKTASSILCSDSVREARTPNSEKDNAVKSKDFQIVKKSNLEVASRDLPSLKSLGSDQLKSSSVQREGSWLDQSCSQIKKWSSSNTLQDSRVSRTKTFSSVQISKRISHDRRSIESKWSGARSKSSFSSSKTNSILLKTDEIGEFDLNEENKESKLPTRGTKVGIAMQQGLRNYIHKLKMTLSERENYLVDSEELASLSLTDAILPDIETDLNENEVQQLQELLNEAEKFDSKKSDAKQ